MVLVVVVPVHVAGSLGAKMVAWQPYAKSISKKMSVEKNGREKKNLLRETHQTHLDLCCCRHWCYDSTAWCLRWSLFAFIPSLACVGRRCRLEVVMDDGCRWMVVRVPSQCVTR